MIRTRCRALLVPAALAAASCGVGGALAGSAGGGGGGGGGGSTPPPPSVVVAVSGGESVANLVPVSYVLRDPQVRTREGERQGGDDDPRVRVTPQWEDPAAPGVWNDMTEADVAGSQGRRALALGPHTFVWNTVLDLGAFPVRRRLNVRVLAEYEETSGIRRRFRTRPTPIQVDMRLAGTLAGGPDAEPRDDLDTFPVDVRTFGNGLVIADFGANIVEGVDSLGLPRRLLGLGVPGDTVDSGKSPGVARLQTLIGVEIDPAGNLYTNHAGSILFTNRSLVPRQFGALAVPPSTVVRGLTGLQDSRGIRRHPSGVLLFLDQSTMLLAFNPQDPLNPASSAVTLAGVVIAPGEVATMAGGGGSDAEGIAATATSVDSGVAVSVGPDGEVYYLERSRARVRVVNTGTSDLTIGGQVVAAGTVRTVAGSGSPGFSGDAAPAASAQLSIPGAIDVSPERHLYVADTGNVRVRLANLGAADVTFAETTIAPGDIDTVVGGGAGGVGSKAREIQLAIPNAVAANPDGDLLVADERSVILVNHGTTAVTSYGFTAGAGRTARVYDASRRGGIPLTEPRAVHSSSPTEVFFTDRATVRVLNLDTTERVFGGAAAAPGAIAIVGGGSVPGFGGDGGSARNAAFSEPSALATQGRLRLFVADTRNQRIRLVNLGDPRLPSTETDAYLGQAVAPGTVVTVVGGSGGVVAGDGDFGAAAAASLLDPEGVAIGPDGLLWIADTGHHRLRVVNPGADPVTVAGTVVASGTIVTIVGDGTAGYTGDGALPRRTSSPSCVAVDQQGAVYFGERGNSRVRCVNPTAAPLVRAGITIGPARVETLVGTGVAGNSGDGGDGPSAQVDAPRALFVQSRLDQTPVALFFTDEDSQVVRMLNLTADDDLSLALDPEGRVLVTIPAASVFTVAGGPNTAGFPNVPSLAGDGDAPTEMRFNFPFGIAVTTSANRPAHFFVADRRNDRLRRFGAPPLAKTN